MNMETLPLEELHRLWLDVRGTLPPRTRERLKKRLWRAGYKLPHVKPSMSAAVMKRRAYQLARYHRNKAPIN